MIKFTGKRRRAYVDEKSCVACGECVKWCPRNSISVNSGCYAVVSYSDCVGCGICAKNCPGGFIHIHEEVVDMRKETGYGQETVV